MTPLTPEHAALERMLRGTPEGLTRQDLVWRLKLPDRKVRQLIEDLVAGGHLPIVADRTQGGEAKYRVPRADEIDLVNAEHAELQARAISLHERARGLVNAFQRHHATGSLFFHE